MVLNLIEKCKRDLEKVAGMHTDAHSSASPNIVFIRFLSPQWRGLCPWV
jgi:hypothetical protein